MVYECINCSYDPAVAYESTHPFGGSLDRYNPDPFPAIKDPFPLFKDPIQVIDFKPIIIDLSPKPFNSGLDNILFPMKNDLDFLK